MNPVDRYAALKLLEGALKAALADAAAEADAYRREVRAKALETDHGTVTVTRRKPAITVSDDAALIDWCRDNLPNLVQRSITAEARSWLLGRRFAISDDGDPIDPVTGEVLPFLAVTPGAEFLTFRATPAARAAAAAFVADRIGSITAAPALEAGQGGEGADS